MFMFRKMPRKILASYLFVFLSVIAFISVPQAAFAQDQTAFQVQMFRPWADPQGMFQTESATTLGKRWDYTVGFMLNYANEPLILRDSSGKKIEGGGLVSSQTAMDLNFGIALMKWLDVYLALPITLYQSGALPANRSDLFGADAGKDVSGFYLSDIKLGFKFGILQQKKHSVNLALKINLGLPTAAGGDQKNFNGEDGISFGARLLFNVEIQEMLNVAVNFGYRYMPQTKFLNLNLQNELNYSLGLTYHLSKKKFDLIFETVGAVALEEASIESAPLDMYFGGRIYPLDNTDLAINIGFGLPYYAGYGSPQFRIFAGLIWAPKNHDTDGDGLNDDVDRCPKVPGPKENTGCPWPDTDKDGLTDNIDKCPRRAGPKENKGCPWGDADGDGLKDNVDKCPHKAGPKENKGCPWGDLDNDGVTDNLDKCPKEAGPKENNGCPWGDSDNDGLKDNVDKCPTIAGPKENNGCPDTDKDGDSIVDRLDKCPDVPGVKERQGCPKVVLVKVEKKKIVILKKIYFKTGSARIRRRSYPVLNQVALVMKSNPNIRVRIEGHTDNVGSARYNLRLSKRRARSVRRYLIRKGIDPSRLESEGYGMTRPLVPNTSRKNRSKNRRVEFKIISQ